MRETRSCQCFCRLRTLTATLLSPPWRGFHPLRGARRQATTATAATAGCSNRARQLTGDRGYTSDKLNGNPVCQNVREEMCMHVRSGAKIMCQNGCRHDERGVHYLEVTLEECPCTTSVRQCIGRTALLTRCVAPDFFKCETRL